MVVYYRLRIYNLWAYKGFPDGWAAKGFPGGLVVKDLPASAGDGGDRGSVFVLGRSPGEGNGSTRHYSCLETSIDRRTWQVTIHAKELGTFEYPCTPQGLICSRNFSGWEKTLILQKRIFSKVTFFFTFTFFSGFPGGSDGKESACGRPRFDPWVRKIPWRREWLATPVFLPGEFHGKESGELQPMRLQRV